MVQEADVRTDSQLYGIHTMDGLGIYGSCVGLLPLGAHTHEKQYCWHASMSDVCLNLDSCVKMAGSL